jgi:hypothetical protein
VSKSVKKYQGFHTHPSQDSTAKTLESGTILVTHRTDRREGYIITQLLRGSKSTADLCEALNRVFPHGGYNNNHVKHSCDRLRKDGILTLQSDGLWIATPKAREKFEKIRKSISSYKASKAA